MRTLTLIAVSVGLVWHASTLVAADEMQELRECAAITDDSKQRDCFARFTLENQPRAIVATPQRVTQPERVISVEEACGSIFELASAIMTARQHGGAMPEVMKAVSEAEIGADIVRDAYSRPIYLTPEYQELEITEFANEYYRTCLDYADPQP